MKNRIRISIAIFLLLLGLLVWWMKVQKPVPPAARKTQPQVGMTAPPTGALPPLPPLPTAPSAPPVYLDPSATPDPEVTQRALASGEKGQMGLAIMQLANAQRIDFYGQIFDQNGQSVSGVKVEGSTLLVLGAENSGGNYYQAVSDSEGRFSFIDAHGNGMGFKFDKSGYEYNYRQPPGWTTDYKPDPLNPQKFNMWKLQGAEPMVHANVHAYVPCDGTATSYDVLTGHKVADGDLVITLTRNPVQIVRGKPFDWTATVQLKDGGLIPITGPYPNEAPADGYQATLTIQRPANAKNWDAAFEGSYYFKTENGKIYGRMTVSIQADFQPPPTSFDVEIYANPAGSRNLEFDPMKKAQP
jgi:hypothetical protein